MDGIEREYEGERRELWGLVATEVQIILLRGQN